MSVEKWIGSYGTTPVAKYADKLREAVALLCEKTFVTVDSTSTSTSSSYAVILHCGGNRYARLSVSYSSGDTAEMTFSTGYKTNLNVYISIFSETWNCNETQVSCSCEVYRINGDDMWELRFPSGNIVYDYYTNAPYYSVLRGTRLVSSLTSEATWVVGLGRAGSRSLMNVAFPSVDSILVDDSGWYMRYTDPSTAKNNIVVEKMLLFPSLICGSAPTLLGVPTVGNQSTYSMSGREPLGIKAYDEFYVNRQLFVSLGRVAIRSK